MEPLNSLKNQSEKIRLTDAERSDMRTGLLHFIHEHPVQTVSPYIHFFAGSWARSGVFAVSLFILIGGGSALAAEGSVPGDALYRIKVSVVEPAIGALQISNSSQAVWQVTLATRRIDEAETVSHDEFATDEVKSETADNVAQSTSDAAQKIQEVAESDESGALPAALAFDTAVTNHQEVIRVLAATSTDATSTAVLTALADQSVKDQHEDAPPAEARIMTAAFSAPVAPTSLAVEIKKIEKRALIATSTYEKARALFGRTHALAEKAKQAMQSDKVTATTTEN